jgi:small subunit ribosomal protein S7e
MFNTQKLMKKEGQKPNELEEQIAKNLQHFEQSSTPALQQHLRLVYVNSAEQLTYKSAAGSQERYILIRIPFRSLLAWRKVAGKVIEHLEKEFRQPVVMVANRTIDSTRKITHASQRRPRSRTLKAVHKAILDDITSPSGVTGRQIRMTVEGRQIEKVFLDPMDRDVMEARLDALTNAYARLTTHTVHFEFSKPTRFQLSKLDKKADATKQTRKQHD